MRFTPKNEAELQISTLLPEGCYIFKVVEAKDKISKTSGNEMIELQLLITDESSNTRIIYDYLLEAMQFKLIHFAKATNLLDKYENGELVADDCIGRVGEVEIIVQPEQPNPNGGWYPPKNAVKDYITPLVPIEGMKNKTETFINDDVPF